MIGERVTFNTLDQDVTSMTPCQGCSTVGPIVPPSQAATAGLCADDKDAYPRFYTEKYLRDV